MDRRVTGFAGPAVLLGKQFLNTVNV